MTLEVCDIMPVICGSNHPLWWLELSRELTGKSHHGSIMANYCRRSLTHRKSPLHCACVPEADENPHHLYPRNCLRLKESDRYVFVLALNLQDFDTNGPSAIFPGILFPRELTSLGIYGQ